MIVDYGKEYQTGGSETDPQEERIWRLEAENTALRRWANAWKACARGYHDKANVCICTYCGHESKKDRLEILEHMLECEKRPDKQLWQALVKAIDDMTKLESENAALRVRVEELEAELWNCKQSLPPPLRPDEAYEYRPVTTGSDHTNYDGEGVA